MFLDSVVISGIFIVGLMVAFFVGFGYIGYKKYKKEVK